MKRAMIGALVLLAVALAAPATADAQDGRWLRLESPGFVIYSAGSEQRARAAVADLEVFDGLLRRFTEAPSTRSPTKLDVYLLSSDQFRDTFHMGGGIVGFYRAVPDQIGAFAIYGSGAGLDGQDVLFHEYAHHFFYQYFSNAYPAWYVEGFAEFVMTAVLGTERITLGRSEAGRLYSLEHGNWMPMERLISTLPNRLSAEETEMYYAQAWLFTHYIVLTNKTPQFRAYVRALRLGQPAEAAFQAGFGMTPAQMQAALRVYLRSSPNAIALTRPAAAEHSDIEESHLPASADNLLLPEARLLQGVGDNEEQALLQQVRQLAGGQPNDRFATLTLARAEVTLGSRDAGRALLEPFLAANPNDVEGLYLMGLSYLRDADSAQGEQRTQLLSQARRYFGRGYRQDGNDVPTLYRYTETYDGVMMNDATYDNYLNIMLLAHQLAPQVQQISINTASALMTKGRNAEAIPILRAIAYDPHAGGSETAQHMLAEAEAAFASGNASAAH